MKVLNLFMSCLLVVSLDSAAVYDKTYKGLLNVPPQVPRLRGQDLTRAVNKEEEATSDPLQVTGFITADGTIYEIVDQNGVGQIERQRQKRQVLLQSNENEAGNEETSYQTTIQPIEQESDSDEAVKTEVEENVTEISETEDLMEMQNASGATDEEQKIEMQENDATEVSKTEALLEQQQLASEEEKLEMEQNNAAEVLDDGYVIENNNDEKTDMQINNVSGEKNKLKKQKSKKTPEENNDDEELKPNCNNKKCSKKKQQGSDVENAESKEAAQNNAAEESVENDNVTKKNKKKKKKKESSESESSDSDESGSKESEKKNKNVKKHAQETDPTENIHEEYTVACAKTKNKSRNCTMKKKKKNKRENHIKLRNEENEPAYSTLRLDINFFKHFVKIQQFFSHE